MCILHQTDAALWPFSSERMTDEGKWLTCVHDCEGLLCDDRARALDCLCTQVKLVQHAGVQVAQGGGGLVGEEGHDLDWPQFVSVVDCR